MWYRLRVEADTNAGKAKIWLNGRVVGEASIANKAVDKFTVSGTVNVDNVKVYEVPAVKDYAPAPAAKAKYTPRQPAPRKRIPFPRPSSTALR